MLYEMFLNRKVNFTLATEGTADALHLIDSTPPPRKSAKRGVNRAPSMFELRNEADNDKMDFKIRKRNLMSNMQKFYAILRDIKCNKNAFHLDQPQPQYNSVLPMIDARKHGQSEQTLSLLRDKLQQGQIKVKHEAGISFKPEDTELR